MSDQSSLELKIKKAYPNDAGRGIVRLDPYSLMALGLSPGDVVTIIGDDTTYGKVWRADRPDWGKEIIRIDEFTRSNADVLVDDIVTIHPTDCEKAERVVLAPPEEANVVFGTDAPVIIKRQILNRPVGSGDIVPVMSSTNHPIVRSPGEAIPLVTAETEPDEPVLITESTMMEIREEPIESFIRHSGAGAGPMSGVEPSTETESKTELSDQKIPDYLCGHTKTPPNAPTKLGEVTCIRPVWKHGKCIWHATGNRKPLDKLRDERTSAVERLDGARLNGAELEDAVAFTQCSLVGSNFDDANVTGANLSQANLQDATFAGADLTDANLSEADLSNADLSRINAQHADFSGADLRGSDLSNADLDGVDFSNAYLWEANLSGATLNDVDFGSATLEMTDFTGATIQDVDLSGQYLDGADLSGANLSESNLIEAGLEGANLSAANLRNATLAEARLREANFTGTSLENADLSGAALESATFRSATLSGADLSKANFNDATFEKADLKTATLEDSSAVKADFTKANLERAVLTQADLFDAILTDARLYGAVFTDARINDGTDFGARCVYERGINRESPNDDEIVERLGKAEWSYRKIEELSWENAQHEQARWAYVNHKDVRLRLYRHEGLWGNLMKAAGSKLLMGYGENPWRVVSASLVIIGGCGLLYPFVGGVKETAVGTDAVHHRIPIPVGQLIQGSAEWVDAFLTSMYFSFVTFTTLGYGDIRPATGAAQFLATAESFVGALMMALLVFVLGRRATR